MTTPPQDVRWPGAVSAITVFAEDLAAMRSFYGGVLGLPVVFEDEVSAAFDLFGTVINVLAVVAASELVAPATVAPAEAGTRTQFTISVDDVDGVCALLVEGGVELLNGPMDRPWGVRTAAFTDPAGHVWEIAEDR